MGRRPAAEAAGLGDATHKPIVQPHGTFRANKAKEAFHPQSRREWGDRPARPARVRCARRRPFKTRNPVGGREVFRGLILMGFPNFPHLDGDGFQAEKA